nr:unnamed protein product [Digitaria exilis]
MERVLDRYERYLLCEGGDVVEDQPEETQGNLSYDHIKLRSRIEALQKSQRNLMGKHLESLTFREVQQLEHQICSALRNIRSRKVHITCTLNVHEKEALDASLHATNNAASSTAAEPALPNLNVCAGDSDEPGQPPATIGLPWWILRPPDANQQLERH